MLCFKIADISIDHTFLLRLVYCNYFLLNLCCVLKMLTWYYVFNDNMVYYVNNELSKKQKANLKGLAAFDV